MTGQLRARLGVALAIGAIWLGALAVPASAATTTVRYVDDNTGANRCYGTNFHTIQGAINASNAADVVYVCPGTYTEHLTLDVPGLTVQSLSFQKAHLQPPSGSMLSELVLITADGAKFRGFKLDIPAGPVGPLATGSSTVATCQNLEAAVVSLANRVGVWGNYIDAIGDATLSGACGYDIGILFLGDVGPAFTALGPNKSSAKRNYIRDFKLAGILAEGSGVSVRLLRNAIRYVHQDDPFTCVPINTIQATPQLTFPCELPSTLRPNPLGAANGIFGGVGIGIGAGAKADVAFNTIFSTLDFALLEGSQIPLFAGVAFVGAAPGSRITENVVTQVFIGILVEDVFLPVTGAETAIPPTGGVDVTFNRTNEGLAGIVIGSSSNYIYANRARLNVYFGIGVGEASDNLFLQNDARYQLISGFSYDCYDGTTGTGTAGTANTWEGSFGNYNSPQEICIEAGPF